jgi:hypothetical protein
MKKILFAFIGAFIAISFCACYPSDPEVSPFVGKWQDKKGTIVRITNDYIFFDAELRPTLRYTTDDKNFYLVSTKLESYKRECAYSYNNGVLYIQKFIKNEMYEGHRDAVLTRVEK